MLGSVGKNREICSGKIKDAKKGGITMAFAKEPGASLPAVVFADNYYRAKHGNLAAILYKDLPGPPPGAIHVFLKNCMLRV
ncbi:hypothetical protein [Mucilaginibacter sp.]|uniref:hypothetical protein n=1 Tax=Mucilaginibacter sp. TaxID=1882438 RepID=UPI0025FCF36C|nr:hypothetical protein [Mucilaginibacter sp.]